MDRFAIMGTSPPPIDGATRGGAPLPRVAKPSVARDLGPVDVAPLQAGVGRLSEKVWRQEDAVKENA